MCRLENPTADWVIAAVAILIKNISTIIHADVTSRPIIVTGTMSPYPVVVMVTSLYQRLIPVPSIKLWLMFEFLFLSTHQIIIAAISEQENNCITKGMHA